MAPSSQPENVLQLGKRLVRQLGLDDSTDTLSRWIAHALAERMEAVETAEPSDRDRLEHETIDLILKLWSHRRDFPADNRPFKDVEDLSLTLAQLVREEPTSRYFSSDARAAIEEAPNPARMWLKRALAIEQAARAVINYCLSAADEATPGDRRQWADLAEAAGLGDDVDVRIVRFTHLLPFLLEEEQSGDLATRALASLKEKTSLMREIASKIESDVSRKLRSRKKVKTSAEDLDSQL
jgi:hypothetical protein